MNSVQMRKFWDGEWEKYPGIISPGTAYIKVYEEPCSVLEIGCGDLSNSPFPHNSTRFVGIDIAHKPLKRNNKKTVVTASALELPFKDNSFDIVIAVDTLTLLGSEIPYAIAEMKRVTRDRVCFNVTHRELSYKWALFGVEDHGDFAICKDIRLDKAVFTEDQIETLVKKLGLESVLVQSFDGLENRVPREQHNNPDAEKYDLKWMIYVLAKK